MLGSVLKATVFINLALWFRPRLKGLALLLAVVGITWLGQHEYVSYLNATAAVDGSPPLDQDAHSWKIGVSYAIKWAISILALAVALFYCRKTPADKARMAQRRNRKPPVRNDGFDFLRAKDQLTTKGERLLSGKGADADSLLSGPAREGEKKGERGKKKGERGEQPRLLQGKPPAEEP